MNQTPSTAQIFTQQAMKSLYQDLSVTQLFERMGISSDDGTRSLARVILDHQETTNYGTNWIVERLTTSKDAQSRNMAATLLTEVGSQLKPIQITALVERCLFDDSPVVRSQCVEALAKAPSSSIAAFLPLLLKGVAYLGEEKLVNRNEPLPDQTNQLISMISKHGGIAARFLGDMIEEGRVSEQLAAIRCLEVFPSELVHSGVSVKLLDVCIEAELNSARDGWKNPVARQAAFLFAHTSCLGSREALAVKIAQIAVEESCKLEDPKAMKESIQTIAQNLASRQEQVLELALACANDTQQAPRSNSWMAVMPIILEAFTPQTRECSPRVAAQAFFALNEVDNHSRIAKVAGFIADNRGSAGVNFVLQVSNDLSARSQVFPYDGQRSLRDVLTPVLLNSGFKVKHGEFVRQ